MLLHMRGPLRVLSSRTGAGVTLVLFALCTFVLFHRDSSSSLSLFLNKNTLSTSHAKFWKAFFNDIERYGPKCSPITHPEDTHLDVFYNASDPRPRPNFLEVTDTQLHALKTSHTKFVNRISERKYDLPYHAGTRGIVTTAGGPYLIVALMSIRMLRQTNSTLPVEVFLGTRDEFDPDICGTVLPSLGAKCIVLEDIFNAEGTQDIGIDKYQYKIMSILFSSFEEVLFMDSDCFPLHDPEPLFTSEPFKETGLVLWPDFWYPSESHYFFEIANIEAPPLQQKASTESGEILYSKRRHDLSIMLAVYYNYYGPEFYYPLQSQGAPGEGDKETFLWSAIAVRESFYAVRARVHPLGYITSKGDWRGSAMAQFDPVQDHQVTQQEMYGQPNNLTSRRPFFVHANFPKLEPSTVYQINSFGATGPTRDDDGTIRRIWHSDATDAINFFGYDVEKVLWAEMRDVACTYEDVFATWKYRTNICATATEYWEKMYGATEVVRTEDLGQ